MGHGVFLAQTHLPGTLVNKAERPGLVGAPSRATSRRSASPRHPTYPTLLPALMTFSHPPTTLSPGLALVRSEPGPQEMSSLQRYSQVLNLELVAAMTEPPCGVSGGDLGECPLHRLQQGFVGARSELPQDVLYLAEGLLYGVQVRRIGGHEHELGSPLFDELPYPLWPVSPEFVEHHHLPLRKRRAQEVLDVGLEDLSVRGSLFSRHIDSPIPCKLISQGDQSQVLGPVLLGTLP